MAIKILHLSDIHWSDKPDGLDRYKDIREAFLIDIKDYCESKGKIDYILICGDIAFSGNEEEYKRAEEFIQEICDITKCSRENVLLVPGNHDKNRKAQHISMRKMISAGLSHHFLRDDLLNDYFRESPELISILFEPFRAYCTFSSKYSSADPIMLRSLQMPPDSFKYEEKRDKLYWETEIGEINGYKIVIYGFNTALNCDEHDWDYWRKNENDYVHKMFLPKIAYNIPKRGLNIVRILMAHHPIEYLANGDDIKKNLSKIFQIQFYGHVHKYNPLLEDNTLIIHSGAFQPDGKISDEYYPIYNVVDIDIEPKDEDMSILMISTDVQKWKVDGRDEFTRLVSDNYKIDLPHHKSRFTRDEVANPTQTQDLILLKRKVRIGIANEPNLNKIIKHFTKDINIAKRIRYDIECDFLDWIDKNNKWNEVCKFIESK